MCEGQTLNVTKATQPEICVLTPYACHGYWHALHLLAEGGGNEEKILKEKKPAGSSVSREQTAEESPRNPDIKDIDLLEETDPEYHAKALLILSVCQRRSNSLK